MSQSSFWIFTQNNPEVAPLEIFKQALKDGLIKYAIYQKEKAPETGTIHYQGYVELSRSQRLSFVRKLLPGNPHWEIRRGSAEQARDYCSKEETRVEGPFEVGTFKPSQQGKRNDLALFTQLIADGASDRALIESCPKQFFLYSKSVDRVRTAYAPIREHVTELYVVIGDPGFGKSSWVRSQSTDLFVKPPGKEWWNGYNGQADVLLDDYYGYLPFHVLLNLADTGDLQVEIKGGYVRFTSKRIYITSNKEPREWYKEPQKYVWPALYRRITKVIHFTAFKEYREYNSWEEYSTATTVITPYQPALADEDYY